jgi:fido (protein-threonine AMPylation protein)
MPGAFDVSLEKAFELDELRTAEEIERCGQEVLRWLEGLAASEQFLPVDIHLIREIHFRWFETTFPADAGRERTQVVLNRKGTAAPVEGIIDGVMSACGNWTWRRENIKPSDAAEEIEFIVAEANSLAVAVYDVHPFVDGNTRATWHLRNYVLMLDGLHPLLDLADEGAYNEAWWKATPLSHDELDRVVLEELGRLIG